MTDEKKSQGESRKEPRVPTAVDRWNHAVREAYAEPSVPVEDDPGARAILEASDEEIERQLVAAGFDLAAEDAKAAATYEAAVAKFGPGPWTAGKSKRDEDADEPRSEAAWVAEAGPRSNVVPLQPRRSRSAWVAYALVAAAATGTVAYVAGHRSVEEPKHDEPVVPTPDPVTPTATAAPAPPPAPMPAPRRNENEKDKKRPR